MNFDLEILGDKSLHAVVYHQQWAVGRIEDGKVQYGAQEVGMLTEVLSPFLELLAPLSLVFFQVVHPIKEEGELVIGVVGITKNTHHVQVELLQVSEIISGMLLYFQGRVVGNSQWIAPQQVLDLDIVNEVL